MDLNKAMLIGRLTRDPELRTIPNGSSVANFALATNRVYTDKDGNRKELVEFHDIVVWRKLAEIAAQYLKKGAKAYIEGRLQTRSWDDPNGFKRYKTEIVADNMIMLDRPAGNYSNSSAAVGTVAPSANVKQPAVASAPSPQSAAPESGEEDLPTIDISEEGADEAEVSVEDIPF